MRHIKLFEQYSEEEYDRILDIYNEKGLDGLTPEEKEYLKSGGESKIPEAIPKWKKELHDLIKSYKDKGPQNIDPFILNLSVSDFFKYINKIYPKSTPWELDEVKFIVRKYIEHDYNRSRGFDFMQGILDLGKKLGIDPNYRW